jgi:hypothetical protein
MKNFGLVFLISCLLCLEVFAQSKNNDDANFSSLAGVASEEKESDSSFFQPKLTSRLIVEGAFDHNYQSTNRAAEFREIQARVRFYSNLNITKKLGINAYVKAEKTEGISEAQRRLSGPGAGGDRSFENNAIVMEELNLSYRDKNYAFIAGKFNLNFGSAWKWNRGLWLHEIADNYREREKLGLSASMNLGDRKKTGQYNFGFVAFTNDSKNFDGSIGSNRDYPSKDQGTPGDKRGLHSYLASLDINFDFGEKFGSQETLSYHFSYINLAVNERTSPVTPTKIDDQKGFAAGLNYKYPFAENLSFDTVLEYAKIRNLNGDSDIHENYFSANSIARIYQNWLFVLGYGQRQNIEIDQNGFDQNLSEISVGYDFGKTFLFDRLTIQTGYKNQRTNFKTSVDKQNAYGVLLRYYKNF